MSEDVLLIIGFNLFVVAMLALDLGVFHRKAHTVRVREALVWSAVWITLALIFGVGVGFMRGFDQAIQFYTGYLIEESLSVDNLFVFLVVFTYFGVPTRFQHKVLFWGILGAALMRATLIVLGSALIQRFHWVIFIFGALLVVTGIRMVRSDDSEVHPEKNPVVRLFKRFFPVASDYHEGRFFVELDGKKLATPLFIVLLVLETTDLVFAVDSIPAIFAVTTDPVIVYTSNIFAILGLRSMYFGLAGMMELFHYLKYGLSVVLIFIGSKMLMSWLYDIPIWVTLPVVAGILGTSVGASILWPMKQDEEKDGEAVPVESPRDDQG